MNLQRDAVEAVRVGMQEVDEQISGSGASRRTADIPSRRSRWSRSIRTPARSKRSWAAAITASASSTTSLAKRQPGSIFKPFVYAAALDTAVQRRSRITDRRHHVVDEPTTFWFDDKPYEPSNFKHEFYGTVTLREALAHSLNVATVKVAEMVGYDNVVDLARRAGLNYDIQPTPAVALGAYEVTPLEIGGRLYHLRQPAASYVKPSFISMVRDAGRQGIYANKVGEARTVLDPRVAYLMTNLMEEVLRSGTGGGGPRARLHGARRRQDRHLARRLVRRLHFRAALRRLGGLRR